MTNQFKTVFGSVSPQAASAAASTHSFGGTKNAGGLSILNGEKNMDTPCSTPNDDNSAATTTQEADVLGSGVATETSASAQPVDAGTLGTASTTSGTVQNSSAANDNSPVPSAEAI